MANIFSCRYYTLLIKIFFFYINRISISLWQNYDIGAWLLDTRVNTSDVRQNKIPILKRSAFKLYPICVKCQNSPAVRQTCLSVFVFSFIASPFEWTKCKACKWTNAKQENIQMHVLTCPISAHKMGRISTVEHEAKVNAVIQMAITTSFLHHQTM